jgi:hypothetical protein
MTQLRAIEILLRKSIPDLAAAEIRSEQTYQSDCLTNLTGPCTDVSVRGVSEAGRPTRAMQFNKLPALFHVALLSLISARSS